MGNFSFLPIAAGVSFSAEEAAGWGRRLVSGRDHFCLWMDPLCRADSGDDFSVGREFGADRYRCLAPSCLLAGFGDAIFLNGPTYRRFYLWSKKISRYTKVITFLSGFLLIGVGVLLFTDRFTLLSMYLNRVLGGRSLEDLLLLD